MLLSVSPGSDNSLTYSPSVTVYGGDFLSNEIDNESVVDAQEL